MHTTKIKKLCFSFFWFLWTTEIEIAPVTCPVLQTLVSIYSWLIKNLKLTSNLVFFTFAYDTGYDLERMAYHKLFMWLMYAFPIKLFYFTVYQCSHSGDGSQHQSNSGSNTTAGKWYNPHHSPITYTLIINYLIHSNRGWTQKSRTRRYFFKLY